MFFIVEAGELELIKIRYNFLNKHCYHTNVNRVSKKQKNSGILILNIKIVRELFFVMICPSM